MSAVQIIIPAAGSGKRFGGKLAKQFIKLDTKTILDHTLSAFLNSELFQTVQKIQIAVTLADPTSFNNKNYSKEVHFIKGGKTRPLSVKKAFDFLKPKDNDFILIHDGVRPLLSSALITRVYQALDQHPVVIPTLILRDTIRKFHNQKLGATINRDELRAIQTPQGFLGWVLKKAYQKFNLDDPTLTDEAILAQKLGLEIHGVEGEAANLKLTHPEDYEWLLFWQQKQKMKG